MIDTHEYLTYGYRDLKDGFTTIFLVSYEYPLSSFETFCENSGIDADVMIMEPQGGEAPPDLVDVKIEFKNAEDFRLFKHFFKIAGNHVQA